MATPSSRWRSATPETPICSRIHAGTRWPFSEQLPDAEKQWCESEVAELGSFRI